MEMEAPTTGDIDSRAKCLLHQKCWLMKRLMHPIATIKMSQKEWKTHNLTSKHLRFLFRYLQKSLIYQKYFATKSFFVSILRS